MHEPRTREELVQDRDASHVARRLVSDERLAPGRSVEVEEPGNEGRIWDGPVTVDQRFELLAPEAELRESGKLEQVGNQRPRGEAFGRHTLALREPVVDPAGLVDDRELRMRVEQALKQRRAGARAADDEDEGIHRAQAPGNARPRARASPANSLRIRPACSTISGRT
jgi:hypothetical protein